MKKYKLTDATMLFRGRTLHRIVALRDVGTVKEGDRGGWIEKEEIYRRRVHVGSMATQKSLTTHGSLTMRKSMTTHGSLTKRKSMATQKSLTKRKSMATQKSLTMRKSMATQKFMTMRKSMAMLKYLIKQIT